jgi:hypothetical protein
VLNKQENRFYFCEPESVKRVQRWEEGHPRYWRKKEIVTDKCLTKSCHIKVSQSEPIMLTETGVLSEAHYEMPANKASFLPRRAASRSVCEGTTLINSI